MDTARSIASIANFLAAHIPDLKVSEREGIAVLLSAHDAIWNDKTIRPLVRLETCNLLFDKAMSFLYA